MHNRCKDSDSLGIKPSGKSEIKSDFSVLIPPGFRARTPVHRLPYSGSRESLDSEDDSSSLDHDEAFDVGHGGRAGGPGTRKPQYRALRKASAPAVCLSSALRKSCDLTWLLSLVFPFDVWELVGFFTPHSLHYSSACCGHFISPPPLLNILLG